MFEEVGGDILVDSLEGEQGYYVGNAMCEWQPVRRLQGGGDVVVFPDPQGSAVYLYTYCSFWCDLFGRPTRRPRH